MIGVLRSILIFVEVACCFLLIALILVQKSKGGGLGAALGGGAGESLFGARTGNVLTKGTVILAVIFMAATLGLAMLSVGSEGQTLMEKYAGPESASPNAPMRPAGMGRGQTPSGVAVEMPAEQEEPAAAAESAPAPAMDTGTAEPEPANEP